MELSMQTTYIKKIHHLEERVFTLEKHIGKKSSKSIERGLGVLAGIWRDRPRSKHDLTRIQKKLWHTPQ